MDHETIKIKQETRRLRLTHELDTRGKAEKRAREHTREKDMTGWGMAISAITCQSNWATPQMVLFQAPEDLNISVCGQCHVFGVHLKLC